MTNNSVSLTGIISKGPDLRMNSNGHESVNFTLAVNRPAPSTTTDKFRITAWEDMARMIDENFKNGDEISVSGRLQNDHWKGRDGQMNHLMRVYAEHVSRAEAA